MSNVTCNATEMTNSTLYSLATCALGKLGVEKANKDYSAILNGVVNYVSQNGYQDMLNEGQTTFSLPADLKVYKTKFAGSPKSSPKQAPPPQKGQTQPIPKAPVAPLPRNLAQTDGIHWLKKIDDLYPDDAPQFESMLRGFCSQYNLDSNGLMAIMAIETGKTFCTKLPNIVGINAVTSIMSAQGKNIFSACDQILDNVAAKKNITRDEYLARLQEIGVNQTAFEIEIRADNTAETNANPPRKAIYPYAFGLIQFTPPGLDAVNRVRIKTRRPQITLRDVYYASPLLQLEYVFDYLVGSAGDGLRNMPYEKIYALVLFPRVLQVAESPTPSSNESIDSDGSGTINLAEVSVRARTHYGTTEAINNAYSFLPPQ